jgi:hypothetical protein
MTMATLMRRMTKLMICWRAAKVKLSPPPHQRVPEPVLLRTPAPEASCTRSLLHQKPLAVLRPSHHHNCCHHGCWARHLQLMMRMMTAFWAKRTMRASMMGTVRVAQHSFRIPAFRTPLPLLWQAISCRRFLRSLRQL